MEEYPGESHQVEPPALWEEGFNAEIGGGEVKHKGASLVVRGNAEVKFIKEWYTS